MNTDAASTSDTPASPPHWAAGQTLKHFQLEGQIGHGGMGVVHRAYDTRLHRAVAVKLLAPELTANTERKQRFLQEARAAARINHPAVAQVFDADEEGGVTFMVMELVDGKTVGQLLQAGGLDLLGTMDIGIQVAEGLAKAHELGIVHRDIKPANVMRTGEGHVKILDFGLAKLVDADAGQGPAGTQRVHPLDLAHTQSGMVMGTPAYMSPEQVNGQPVDFRADIFALGVLLYEMATGRSPFQRENIRQAYLAAAFEEAPPIDSTRGHVPEELQRVISRCLQKKPEDRYPGVRQVADELRRIRRATEANVASQSSWRRLQDLWEELRGLPPSRYGWYAVGLVVALAALYLSLAKIGLGTVLFLAVVGFYGYRHVRNRPHRMQELFVRRVSKIPEVRLIVFQQRQFNVVVDRPVAQLYNRLNSHLRTCNRKLYLGEPMTLSILHELTAGEVHKMLRSPGVQYVRADVVEPEGSGAKGKTDVLQ